VKLRGRDVCNLHATSKLDSGYSPRIFRRLALRRINEKPIRWPDITQIRYARNGASPTT